MPDHVIEDEYLDLSPEVMCQLMRRRRSRTAALEESSSRDDDARRDHRRARITRA